MNDYGQTILNEIVDYSSKMNYTLKRVSETVLTKTAPWGVNSTHTWLKKEETMFQQQIPHLLCCLVRSELEGFQYDLHIKDDLNTYVITVELPNPEKTSEQFAYCYVSEGYGKETNFPLNRMVESLSEWVQNLPENRLRFATGQWIMEHHATIKLYKKKG